MSVLLLDLRVRSARSEAIVSRRDLDALAWAGEQYAVRLDQLEPLLECGPRTVQRTVARLRDAGLAVTRRVLVGEPAWLLPTSMGLRACGSSFGAWQPRLSLIAHVAAVNDVRLHIQSLSPESEWVCERAHARDRTATEHLPDALVLLDGRRVAIEVERTIKSKRRTTLILDELCSRFDSVVYFCAPGPHGVLGEFSASGRWPRLEIRELPSRALASS